VRIDINFLVADDLDLYNGKVILVGEAHGQNLQDIICGRESSYSSEIKYLVRMFLDGLSICRIGIIAYARYTLFIKGYNLSVMLLLKNLFISLVDLSALLDEFALFQCYRYHAPNPVSLGSLSLNNFSEVIA